MQWNARSAVSNKQSLKQFLVNEDIDIALISETWFKPNKHTPLLDITLLGRIDTTVSQVPQYLSKGNISLLKST
nr:unnamed protein product [Callosobruchus chinensis]